MLRTAEEEGVQTVLTEEMTLKVMEKFSYKFWKNMLESYGKISLQIMENI